MTPPVPTLDRSSLVARRCRGRSGFTLLEMAVALPIVLVASAMIVSTLMASTQQRAVQRERALATEAMRIVFEEMRNEDFAEVFARYNREAFDDPGGPGTAPGHLFPVEGLRPLDGAEGGAVGEILLPVVNTGGAIDTNWELREDVPSDELGTPRDLNGDTVIDALDHALDYRVLPVCIVARWQGRLGPREMRMHTVLADWSFQN